MSTTPYDYQIQGATKFITPEASGGFGGRALLADSMGLGKSLTSILSAKMADWFPMIVVCPAGLRVNWQRECTKHLGLRSEILSGMRAPSNRASMRLFVPPPIHIINYEVLDPWMTHLQLLRAKLVVFDEGHYLSNRTTLRSRLARELVEDIPNRLILTGTPLPNRPADLWNLLNLLRPDLYPDFFTFALEYCELKKEFGQWNYRGATNLPQLHAKLTSELMIRRRREDVILELPPLRRIVLPIPIDERDEYHDKLKEVLGKSVGQKASDVLVELNELSQYVGRKKLPYVCEWINNFLEESDGKLLVFGIHHEVLEYLHKRYKNSVLIYGKRSQADRVKDEDSFQNDPGTRVCFGNIHAMGVGLNLTAAHTVMVCEFPWKPSDLEQAVARCYARVGDMHGADVYYLVGTGTIEEHKVKLLQKKQDIADQVIDGVGGVSNFDIADQLLNSLREEEKS